jgi:hypothetical protein
VIGLQESAEVRMADLSDCDLSDANRVGGGNTSVALCKEVVRCTSMSLQRGGDGG